MSLDFGSINKVTKGTLGGKQFEYNPTAFNDSISVGYNEVKSSGMSYPRYSYGGGNTRKINFDIFLNDREGGETRKFISHLHSFIPGAGTRGVQFKAPKPIVFSFGWFVKNCLLESMDINYTKFSKDLQPIQATVGITLIILQ